MSFSPYWGGVALINLEQGVYAFASGNAINGESYSLNTVRTAELIPVSPSKVYTVDIQNSINKDIIVFVYEYDSSQEYISYMGSVSQYVPFKFTTSATTKYLHFAFRHYKSASGTTDSTYNLSVDDLYDGILY